jgi:hypothetical protein
MDNYKKVRELYLKVKETFRKYEKFGTDDSEVDGVLQSIIHHAILDGKQFKARDADHWQLFNNVGADSAAAKMNIVVKNLIAEILKVRKGDLDKWDFDEGDDSELWKIFSLWRFESVETKDDAIVEFAVGMKNKSLLDLAEDSRSGLTELLLYGDSIYTLQDRANKSGAFADLGNKLWFKWTSNVPVGYEETYVYYLDVMKNKNVKVIVASPSARGFTATTKTLTRPEEYYLVPTNKVPSKAVDAVNKKI